MQTETETQSKPEFEPNQYYENLLRVKSDNPKTFSTLSRALRDSVEIYERRKLRNTKGEK